jgi:hypothetical protein
VRRSIYAHSRNKKAELVLFLEQIMGVPSGELREWYEGNTSIRLSLETCDKDGNLCDSFGNKAKSS